MPTPFYQQVNGLLALRQALQEAIDAGDGEEEARAALQDAQKRYIKEVEIGIRVEDKHGLTHRPKDMAEIAMLQLHEARELRKVMEGILDVLRARVCPASL